MKLSQREKWSNAIRKIKNGGDVKPLAKLLRGTKGKFEDVHFAIAELLDPQSGYFNFQLKLRRKRGKPTSPQSEEKRLKIALAVAEELPLHKLRKEAIGKVAKDYEVSDKYASDCHKFYVRKFPGALESVT